MRVFTRAIAVGFVPLVLVFWSIQGFVGVPSSRPSIPRTSIEQHSAPEAMSRASTDLTQTLYLPQIAQSYQLDSWTRLTADPANDTQPALSPNGQMAIFVSDRAGLTDVFLTTSTGGQAFNLTQTPLAREDTPVFSPDGSRIAFASDRSGDWDIYLMNLDGSNVQPAVTSAGTDELHPAFAPDGPTLFFSGNREAGNWDIYTATISGGIWGRLTTDPAADRFPSLSMDGSTVAFRSERDGNSEIYWMNVDGTSQRRVTTDASYDGYPSIAPDRSGAAFTSWRTGSAAVYGVNPTGMSLVALAPRSGWQADTPRIAPDGRTVLFAARPATGTFDIYRLPYSSPLRSIAERGATSLQGNCDWEAGTLAYGWLAAWQATGDEEYLGRTQAWIDGCIPLKPTISHVNDGLLGYAALVVYEAKGGAQRLAFAQQVSEYLLHTATRTADGTLTHVGDTVWDDTLLGSVPLLVAMSRVTGDPLYLEEAITQTVRHAGHLQNPSTGLFHHAWDESENSVLWPVYWGRGNGWVLLAHIELLTDMPISHPQRATILSQLQMQANALKPLQDASGLWHTVVTRSDYYLETSASALIGYAFARAVHAGWLNASDYAPAARAALWGVWRKTLADGSVTDVSAPTGPMFTEPEYNAIPHTALQLYGQGVALLLASSPAP